MHRIQLAFCVVITLASAATADEWQTLFNGRDISGWQTIGNGDPDNWSAADGVLVCHGKPGEQWLATEEQFSDFELSLEFNVPENGNSGVFLRAPTEGVPYVDGIEVQILDDYGEKWKDLKPAQFTGAIYAVVAPSQRVTKKAGQWQSMVVRCEGRRVRVVINGTKVVDANLDDYQEDAKKVPGLKRTAGHIGLQNHGDRLSFRKLRVRRIDPQGKDSVK